MKKVLITMLVLIEVFSLSLLYKSYNNKNVLEDNKKEVVENNNSSLAIKVENDSGDYVFASSFPGDGYYINESMTECVDQAGNTVDGVNFSVSETSVTVDSKYTAYCTLYFGKCKGPVGTVLEGKDQVNQCLAGGMYRYQGTNNVNNWICFGTSDKGKCTTEEGIDKYMYRIIGVTPNGELALVKETFAKIDDKTIPWTHNYTVDYCGSDGAKCNWVTSLAYNRLNGLCTSNNSNCNGTGTGSWGQNNAFIGNSYYEYLNNNSEWLNKINNHTWKYGETKDYDNYNYIDNIYGNYDKNDMYSTEKKFTSNVDAKIGLLYIHDYLFAIRSEIIDMESMKNSWIHYLKDGYNNTAYEYIIDKYGLKYEESENRFRVEVYVVANTGAISITPPQMANIGTRPVFYLKPDVKISNTAGSKDDPFIIS